MACCRVNIVQLACVFRGKVGQSAHRILSHFLLASQSESIYQIELGLRLTWVVTPGVAVGLGVGIGLGVGVGLGLRASQAFGVGWVSDGRRMSVGWVTWVRVESLPGFGVGLGMRASRALNGFVSCMGVARTPLRASRALEGFVGMVWHGK